MILFFEKFKIPTILGLGIILSGIVVGVFLVLKEQVFISKASLDILPIKETVVFTNTDESSVTVSWRSTNPAISFVTYGLSSASEHPYLDDRDKGSPLPHIFHYVTLKNLLPASSYQLKIITGKKVSDTFNFKTAFSPSSQNNFGPVIGSIVEDDKPMVEGIAYLSVANATIQSSLVKNLGNFLIPLSKVEKADLNEAVAKLTIIGKTGQATVIFKLKNEGVSLPVIKLGQTLDLTNQQLVSQVTIPSAEELKTFDLNSDGQINAADNAIVLRNFGKNPKEKKADLNSDGVVDQKDLDLMSKKFTEQVTP